MDADLTALAWKGASTVVALLATDAWEKAKKGLGSLWRRVHPERAGAVEVELAETRARLLDAREQDDTALEGNLTQAWQGRLTQLLAADPEAAAQLKQLLDEVLVPALSEAGHDRIGKIEMRAEASGKGRVYQAGRDQHIRES